MVLTGLWLYVFSYWRNNFDFKSTSPVLLKHHCLIRWPLQNHSSMDPEGRTFSQVHNILHLFSWHSQKLHWQDATGKHKKYSIAQMGTGSVHNFTPRGSWNWIPSGWQWAWRSSGYFIESKVRLSFVNVGRDFKNFLAMSRQGTLSKIFEY